MLAVIISMIFTSSFVAPLFNIMLSKNSLIFQYTLKSFVIKSTLQNTGNWFKYNRDFVLIEYLIRAWFGAIQTLIQADTSWSAHLYSWSALIRTLIQMIRADPGWSALIRADPHADIADPRWSALIRADLRFTTFHIVYSYQILKQMLKHTCHERLLALGKRRSYLKLYCTHKWTSVREKRDTLSAKT